MWVKALQHTFRPGSGGAAERPRYATKLAPPADAGLGKTVRVQLTAAERLTALSCFGGRSLPMWTFTSDSEEYRLKWVLVSITKLGHYSANTL
jgi:hypothetical protein